ncbi:MAG: histidine kinase, partial [Kangiellaceae bacterium]|nr:histidine kinase [Kangiellaceae bacterium]
LSMPVWYWTYQLLLFGACFGACVAIIFYRRSNANKIEALKIGQEKTELELQFKELQMKSLQTQLEPHFLFNALNSISGLVRISEKKLALDAIKQVSDLLRYAVDASNHLFVRFDDELAFVRDYLALQELRFEDKLKVDLIDNRTSFNQECPPFILQIFVENAIRHGLERAGETMELSVKISNNDSKLSLFIQNTHQRSKKNGDTLGIGLKNLRDRIDILYQQPIEFEQFETAQHYTVEISIPEASEN